LGFGFEPGLEFSMCVLRRVEKLLDAGERAAGRCGACFDGLVGTVEIIPCESLDVGPENQVSVPLPYFELVLLSGAHSAGNHLKDVGGNSAMPIFDAYRDRDDVLSAKIARGTRGNLRDQTSVGEAAGANLDRFEQARESATRADGFREISVSENHGFSVGQVRSDDRHRNLEIFEALRFENLLDQVAQPVIAGEAQAGNAPAPDVAKTNLAASANDASQRRTAGIRRPKNAAHAGPCDVRNWYVIFFKDLQNAEMGESARKPTAQSQAQSCSFRRGRWPNVQ
jgi:hypothetical protein